MRGREEQDAGLRAFISARTQDLHHDAYQLTAGQESAERLVVAVLSDLRRQHVDLSRAGAIAFLQMARIAARDDRPTADTGDPPPPERFRPLVRLSPRQRAALLLQVVAGYDERAITRALQLSSRTTTDTLRSIPYTQLPRQPGELRSLLEDFGDLATSPSATTTIHDIDATPPAPRRPWWTYVASLLVIALTVTCVIVTQGWHNDWLRTPDGLNHAHGTHFPTYLQGYQLVDIRDMVPGIAQDVTTGARGAVALPCGVVDPTVRLSVQSAASERDEGDSCPQSATRARLTQVEGRASAMVLGGTRDTEPIAVYRKIPLSEYPVATKDFEVQHDLTLNKVRREAAGNTRPQDASEHPVLTLRGTASHHNGTFRGRLLLPADSRSDLGRPLVHAVGLLSPTTTGQFRVRIEGVPPTTSCGEREGLTERSPAFVTECSFVDRQVPQVKYLHVVATNLGWVPVEIVVRNARGPWVLEVVADTDRIGAGSTD
ncbi:MAG TPA: hypothetical protein VG502_09945 [Flexivirga sp.]|uniref:hypothetical protein n=1 Tax=Flexivirga sp. TaxID=1962927 RepID=UPI002CFE725E|nr:hypothetical protein [Flexivirga sp.]HWC22609.1 hypothetical protein [Flexivirga sp.]